MPKPHRSPTLLGLVAVSLCAGALAQEGPGKKPPVCDTNSTVVNLQKNASLTRFFAGPETCNSLRNIFKRLSGSSIGGGKKLEDDRPLDVAAAIRERRTAQADAEFAAELKALLAGETDALRRLLLEAALLDENGHYAARDLLIQEARTLMGASK